jgi:hypothetical protein
MPRSRNLGPRALRPRNNDFYEKMISKMSVFEKGSRILESRGTGLGGRRGMPRSRNLGSKAPRPGNVDLYKKMMSKRSFFERGSRILESRGPELEEGGCPDPGI